MKKDLSKFKKPLETPISDEGIPDFSKFEPVQIALGFFAVEKYQQVLGEIIKIYVESDPEEFEDFFNYVILNHFMIDYKTTTPLELGFHQQ